MNILGYYINKEFVIRNRDFIFPILFLILYTSSLVFDFIPGINVFGGFLVVYVPGTALIRMLFPKEEEIDIFERTLLGIGISIITTTLIGFIFVNTIGLTFGTSLITVLGLSVAFLAGAYYRVFR